MTDSKGKKTLISLAMLGNMFLDNDDLEVFKHFHDLSMNHLQKEAAKELDKIEKKEKSIFKDKLKGDEFNRPFRNLKEMIEEKEEDNGI